MADLSLSRNTSQGTACVGDQSFVSTWSKDALVLGAYIYIIYIYMVNVCLTAFILYRLIYVFHVFNSISNHPGDRIIGTGLSIRMSLFVKRAPPSP